MPFFWTQRQDIGPSARLGHALAYDASRSRILLVGGDGLDVLHRDTWLWDGETWTQVEDIGPSGRAGHAVAYDSARERVVLFGGRSAAVLSDTWEWDGEAWTQLEDTGPSARSRGTLAYDAARERVVLFGGEDAALTPLGDTWEWNGDEWTQVADTGPSARAGHAMCFETPTARTVLFGGTSTSETWAWNGTDWTSLNDVGPPPVEGAALVSSGQSTILFGGVDPTTTPASLYRLTWELAGSDWTERQDIGPAARFAHAMAYDSARGRIVLFGGSAASPATAADLFSDTWELPVGAQAPDPGPDPGPDPVSSVTLVTFTISPESVGPAEPVTITIGLGQPAAAPTEVLIAIDGMPAGAVTIETGQSGFEAIVSSNDLGLPSGTHEFAATLGAVTLTAALTVL